MGSVVNDLVNVQGNKFKMNFILVNQADGLDQLYCDGIVGFSPKAPIENESKDNVELLIRQMKKSGAIQKAMISFNIKDEKY